MYADDKICKENHFIEKPPSLFYTETIYGIEGGGCKKILERTIMFGSKVWTCCWAMLSHPIKPKISQDQVSANIIKSYQISSNQFSSVSINFKADQVHQNPWKSIKHGSTGSPKKVPKTASIECCARPPMPQVMKVCFILVLGHRYETCTLVFYRGVF